MNTFVFCQLVEFGKLRRLLISVADLLQIVETACSLGISARRPGYCHVDTIQCPSRWQHIPAPTFLATYSHVYHLSRTCLLATQTPAQEENSGQLSRPGQENTCRARCRSEKAGPHHHPPIDSTIPTPHTPGFCKNLFPSLLHSSLPE